MKVALVGAPKTGKTKLAKEMANERYKVVDNIPQKFARKTGLLLGENADHRVNFALAGFRYAEQVSNGANLILTTTVIDSIFYSTLGIEKFELKEGEDPSADLFVAPYYFTTLYLLNHFRVSWDFDKTVFLPYTGKDETWKGRDDIYIKIMEQLGVEYETLKH
jgi:hypothetical protein